MKTLHPPIFLFLLLIVLLFVHPLQATASAEGLFSPTPIYDPLVEPTLPPNPTEYELGNNLYWHWCMTCHGDRGQGLTDEFRGIWEPEHQNCWGRGCHAGRSGDEGFPIPTVVPALVNSTHLSQFSTLQELADFLQSTHPPQSPGILKNNEYHAIALFVFSLNERSLFERSSTSTPVSLPTPTSIASQPAPQTNPVLIGALVVLCIFSVWVLLSIQKRGHGRGKDQPT